MHRFRGLRIFNTAIFKNTSLTYVMNILWTNIFFYIQCKSKALATMLMLWRKKYINIQCFIINAAEHDFSLNIIFTKTIKKQLRYYYCLIEYYIIFNFLLWIIFNNYIQSCFFYFCIILRANSTFSSLRKVYFQTDDLISFLVLFFFIYFLHLKKFRLGNAFKTYLDFSIIIYFI